jgi:hypothetical protein
MTPLCRSDRARATIVIDTREGEPYSFDPRLAGAVRRALAAGDYSLAGLEDQVAVERKTLDDFVSTVIHRRRRFRQELRKLSRYRAACVVMVTPAGEEVKFAGGAARGRGRRDALDPARNALSYSISLMTGGAGSGKTYAVSTIVSIAERLERKVVLAAPTGKAAKRLEEVVGHEASTIHRLLGFNGHSYARDALNPVEADILVVDESSMIDIPLAWRLFQAIDRAKTAVVLVGDHNQLPPVGPGNLLRDLVKSRAIPTAVLTRIIRQAGVLKENSTAILSGEVRPTANVQTGARRPWYVIDRFSDREDVRQMLLLLFEEVLAERLGYDLVRDVQVLTPTHKGPLGTVDLNLALQRLLQKKLRGFEVPEVAPGHRPAFYPGDKVIQTRNDYELGVMNGAMGCVVEATPQGALTVDFDGAVVEIEAGSDAASRLQLAYACSVHKVQGSEFPCAIVIAHKSHSFMHHRNLLYTAVTRAKESVILLGDRWGLDNCAARRQVDRRNTFLSFLARTGGARMSRGIDVHAYYRQITEVDIGAIARELLAGRIVEETPRTLFCDCPNHKSQSRRSLHVMLDKQGWYCFGCGVGGDVLQLVEFVRFGRVTRGQSGPMPESHRQARDFLAARAGLPPLAQLASASPEEAEAEHRLSLRAREALTALSEIYHQRLVANGEVLAWFRAQYGIGDEMIERLKIGYAEDGSLSTARLLMEGPQAFTPRELAATSAFRPTAQDGIVPFFDRRIVFPYWSRGHVVFLIGRRTPWTPDNDWEKAKYKKLAVRNDRNHAHVAACIRNDVLYNEDVLLTRPERVVITEGVTDCISLIEHGFASVSPVTVRIREADWERLVAKLAGVQTVYICQDNEVSEAGMQGALKTARALASHGIQTRVAVLPLGEKQIAARAKLSELPEDSPEVDALRADAKIDVNEFFASGKTAADFEAILAAAQTPLEMAIAKLQPDAHDLPALLDPILAEVHQLDPIEQPRYLKLIQEKCGKGRLPISALRQQMKVVRRS